MGLLDHSGCQVLPSQLLVLTESSQSVEFQDLPIDDGQAPVPSLLRGFSVPVVLEMDFSADQLLTLLAHYSDSFNQ